MQVIIRVGQDKLSKQVFFTVFTNDNSYLGSTDDTEYYEDQEELIEHIDVLDLVGLLTEAYTAGVNKEDMYFDIDNQEPAEILGKYQHFLLG